MGESNRLNILEKSLKTIREILEKARWGTRNPGRRPITPQLPRRARIARRGAVRHKRIISANRGITSFWRSEEITYDQNGQWNIKKAEQSGSEDLYHIHEKGQRLTDKPVTLRDVNEKYGSVQRLEGQGYRLIPHKPKKTNINDTL